jgi:hypothetical protein
LRISNLNPETPPIKTKAPKRLANRKETPTGRPKNKRRTVPPISNRRESHHSIGLLP